MKRFLLSLLCLFLLVSGPKAQLTVNELHGFNVGLGSPPPIITFQASDSSTSNLSSYTFSAQDIGAAANDRFIVVCAFGSGSSNTTVSSITLDGVTMTSLQNSSANQSPVGCAGIVDTADTTDAVVVNFGASMNRAAIGIWRITGLQSTTPVNVSSAINADPLSLDVNTNTDGVVIGACQTFASTSVTWTGVNEDFDAVIEGETYSGGFASGVVSSTPRTLSCNFASAGSNQSGVGLSFR